MNKARVVIWSGMLLSAGAAVAASPEPGAAHKLFQWRPFLAPFHAVVLHFPIGFLTVAGILEVYRAFRPTPELRRATALMLWLGLLTVVLSASFGLMRAGGGGYEIKALELHRLYGLAVPCVTLVAIVLQLAAARKEAARARTRAYHAALAGTLALVVVAGHHGGNLTHGSKYLVENAPAFVRELLEDEPAPAAQSPAESLDARQKFYSEKVQPVLAAKCYKCHGPEKQKGGYRMDQPERALKGGDSGQVAIKPGDPLGSHLMRLVLLPPQHDDVMPPEGREPLTLEEVVVLLDWIRHGAVFPPAAAEPEAAGR